MKRTTKNMTYAAAALAGTAVLAACGTESGSGSGAVGEGDTKDISTIADTTWLPQSVTVDGKEYDLPEGDSFELEDAHITFKPGAAEPDAGGGESGGTVGCNHFGADVEIEGDTVKVSDLAMTLIGCEGAVGEFEEKFVSVFEGNLKAAMEERDGTKILTLTSGKGDRITLREGTAETAPALKGTRWTVDTLLSGKSDDSAAASLPAEAKAHLTLTKNNTVTGSLGCNTFNGKATVKDGTIEIGPLATTRMVCSEPVMKTERELTEILSGKVSYQQKHKSLTITADSGEGLVARAE
ncbi:META domain-containing protein [Streptomyces sp. DG2A-72]|uniref:META domain-containing protein n=1 Tax=Streptomyces sp. DG2A-72 TaxID=3051386 RepID=UPI00265BE423|nr:META domain-containing protein [Streptomyces sp. DG2A-72]MDO0934373.1 META domain-containing protein [Streptomyces sp. DG2A-72]